MLNSTFSFFSSIFGFVVAAISLFAFITKICRSHLPSNRIKVLESLMDETELFFRKAIEDGLLTEPEFIRETERHLTILRTRTYVLRSTAYGATTLRKDFIELFNGTSSVIGRTCDSLRTLRAQVVESSEEGRLRMMEVDSVSPALSNTPITPNCDLEHHTMLLPSAEIARPHSCPPILLARNFQSVQQMSTGNNPFCDPMKSDLDTSS